MIRHYIFILALLTGCMYASGQNDADEEDISEEFEADSADIDDRAARENPVIDESDFDSDISIPSFIKLKRNQIDFNGSDWSKLRADIRNSANIPVSIVHIGDSHLQADFATGEIRSDLQFDYGNAGRGLISPLRLSGTNEPHDYSFSSTQAWNAVKLMNQTWHRTMGFTGTSITPVTTSSNFMVSTSEKEDYNPFSSITVFHKGQFFVTSITDADGNAIPFVATPSKDYTYIDLTQDINAARIYFESAGDLTVFGAALSGKRPGLFYHTIGNNGATYDTYNRIGNVGMGIAPLHPDLVIVSLGTNEAFGIVDRHRFKESIDRLVENIKNNNPEAAILLVTPMECQRSVYSTVTVPSKKRKGKKKRRRRRVTKRVRSFKTNSNISTVRNVIMDYGKEHHIAVYDWYTVAGGDNASSKWINSGLFSNDRVHHSLKGYRIQGELMYRALKSAFENTK